MDLSPAEDHLVQAAAGGHRADYAAADDDLDVRHGYEWGPDRVLRGEFLIELLSLSRGPGAITHRGLVVRGARITGALDLASIDIPFGLTFEACYFDGPITLRNARLSFLRLTGSLMLSIDASQVATTGDVELTNSVITSGCKLDGAHIGGELSLIEASLQNPAGYSLSAQGAVVGTGVFIGRGFRAESQVKLLGIDVRGPLDFGGGTFADPDGVALAVDGATVSGAVFMHDDFLASGLVSLTGMVVKGQLMFNGGTFEHPSAVALRADQANVDGPVFLRGAKVAGELSMVGLKCAGTLDCSDIVVNADATAIDGDQSNLGGNLYFRDARIAGEVKLAGAHVGGQIDGSGAQIANPGGYALVCDAANVTGGLFLSDHFWALGQTSFRGVEVNGQVECNGAMFVSFAGPALALDRASVRGSAFFKGAQFNGAAALAGVTVGGQLSFEGGRPANVNLQGAHVGSLVLRGARGMQTIDLTACTAGVLVDDRGCWPRVVSLEGFAYGMVNPGQPVDPDTRIEWLRRSGRFVPQTYDQLVKVYRDQGEHAAARKVGIARESDRRRIGSPGWLRRGWSLFLACTVRYGYAPGLALVWLGGLWAAGLVLFAHGVHHPPVMDPTAQAVPAFQPVVYVLDLLLPILNFGQGDAYLLHSPQGLYWLYQSYVWLAIVAGWALTTALVVGFAGVFKDTQ